jgi:alpha-L-fucosidase
MKINSEAIYGTRMYKIFGQGDKIRFTQSKDGKTRYIFVFNYPDGKLLLSRFQCSKKASLQLLGSKKSLKWKQKGETLEIEFPQSLKKVTDYVWVVKLSE